MAEVIIDHVSKRYASVAALDNVSLEIRNGEFLTVLGPSGCGKTTLLRSVAGFIEPSAGQIRLGKRVVTDTARHILIPPDRRDIGMVFQNYALWPHMTVEQQIAYPLRVRKIARGQHAERVQEMVRLVQLEGLERRYPAELSGGQQQRVALARALVTNPGVLLLDEPLSNLDARLRAELRDELRNLQRATGVTVLMVTHDQAEAMAVSDRVVVMNRGVVQQVGNPEAVYLYPANDFVASFIGEANLLQCRILGSTSDQPHSVTVAALQAPEFQLSIPVQEAVHDERRTALIRPEDIVLHTESNYSGIPARVTERTYLGELIDYKVRTGDLELRARASGESFDISTGQNVMLEIRRAYLLPSAS